MNARHPAPRRRTLYPRVEPFAQGYLDVGDGHELYYEQCGRPDGRPVLFVHGGPGGGGDENARRFFDPTAWRVIVFDQRGSGRSRPHASLDANTTWHLVDDIERLRTHLGIERWTLFGGSWGSTLSLLYAARHAARIEALVLRGIFLLRRRELDWFFRDGTNRLFPEAWARFRDAMPENERHDLIAAYHRRLTGTDPEVALAAARAWATWEASTSTLLPAPELLAHYAESRTALAMARIECHYFFNGGFLERDDQVLAGLAAIRDVPGTIVQGRYDAVCPPDSALELEQAWPGGRLVIVPDAGHSAYEPGILHALVTATDEFAAR